MEFINKTVVTKRKNLCIIYIIKTKNTSENGTDKRMERGEHSAAERIRMLMCILYIGYKHITELYPPGDADVFQPALSAALFSEHTGGKREA